MKKTIAIDIDDVLAANAAGFAAFSKQRWNSTMTAQDYDEDWAKAWGVPLEEGMRRAEEYHTAEAFREYARIDHAEAALLQLKPQYHLVIVTSRRNSLETLTKDWLDRHFKGVFDAVHFAGIWDAGNNYDVTQALHATKKDVCQAIGADFLIDDQLKHCVAAAEAGIPALLFGDYTWNKHDNLPSQVTRVKDWQAVLEYFDGRA